MLLRVWSMDRWQFENGLMSVFNKGSTGTECKLTSSQMGRTGLHTLSRAAVDTDGKARTIAGIPGSESTSVP